MSIWNSCQWKNLHGICGENDKLSVVILPKLGGKVASLFYKPLNLELAMQHSKDQYDIPYLDADFSRYDSSGLDDAFPNIDGNKIKLSDKTLVYPDHGEIWSSPFSYEIQNDTVCLSYQSKRFPYLYQKDISFKEDSLVIHYKISNTGADPFPCIWTFHGLFRYEEDMELIFPENVNRFIKIFDGEKVGEEKCSCHSISMSDIKPNSMVKYYVDGRVDTGYCGFYYPKHKLECMISYDPMKLPFLGIWITTGGYRGDCNCALEPSNGFFDEIENARKNGCLYYLKEDQPLEFTLQIRLNEVE